MGAHDLSAAPHYLDKFHNVKKIIKHPDWNRNDWINDIAIMELTEEVSLIDFSPACMAKGWSSPTVTLTYSCIYTCTVWILFLNSVLIKLFLNFTFYGGRVGSTP